ncbi:MAG: CRTAC1 family protein [Planctomycetes bacterium]|nr:CRTAC1 family protein [Planctomycetota bacterium]
MNRSANSCLTSRAAGRGGPPDPGVRWPAARMRGWPRPAGACLVAFLACVVLGCRGEAPAQKDVPDASSSVTTREPTPAPPTKKSLPAALTVVPRLDDVARDSGIDFSYYSDVVPNRYFVPEIMGGGAAWIDYDLDGWLDLYLTNGCRIERREADDTEHRNQLFRNLGGGRFANVTLPSGTGDTGYGQGVAVGDFDADGFPDLYVANYGPNVLLHNNGDGTFADVTRAAGVGDDKWGSSVAFADLDGDGDLDIYVANFLDNTLENNKVVTYAHGPGYSGPGNYQGVQDAVYVNQGDGTFLERSEQLGFSEHDGLGKGLCVIVVDLDDDLVPEIYVGNDMTPNFLYVRRAGPLPGSQPGGPDPPVHYEDLAVPAGCAASDQGEYEASMGIACDDFNNDARPDLFLCHFHMAKNTLYLNQGNLLLTDESRRTRIAATSYNNLCFGTVAFDWDRDGEMDLFNATGNVLGPNFSPNEMPPQLLRKDDQHRFHDVSEHVMGEYFKGKWLARAVAGGDYDNDGDLDIAVSHIDRPAGLLRNDTRAPGHFLGIELRTPTRVPPVGGRVEVTAGKRRTVRPVYSGGSYHASHDPRLLFTLGADDESADVTIHWPTGRVDVFRLSRDAYWRIVEGGEPTRVQWE